MYLLWHWCLLMAVWILVAESFSCKKVRLFWIILHWAWMATQALSTLILSNSSRNLVLSMYILQQA